MMTRFRRLLRRFFSPDATSHCPDMNESDWRLMLSSMQYRAQRGWLE